MGNPPNWARVSLYFDLIVCHGSTHRRMCWGCMSVLACLLGHLRLAEWFPKQLSMLYITVEALKHAIGHWACRASLSVWFSQIDVCRIHAKGDVLCAAVDGRRWTGPHGREVVESDFCRITFLLLLLEVCLWHEADDRVCSPNCRRFFPTQGVVRQVLAILTKDSPLGHLVGVDPFDDVKQVLELCYILQIFDPNAQHDRLVERVEPLWTSWSENVGRGLLQIEADVRILSRSTTSM